ncbi:glutamyl-tRNA amidotransferase [Aerococcus urinaehominis]|uniref:Aspartyl/glutamyl-tRNA(Asn/Gln) amidotransferase subunit C n=1 Tax=Aerococcus urinaehominis TaxID=128944 RepID=A0A0X8FMN0_9LACT|nr:Asp-tRNA(Asn)/Glu-tRNA(Gln) amidotransferase subunit GatC [Aerococcus urinaehominis]AMB99457.1 glutamyl-tRNA amidotransferase [Aerococcus urinaehominis]SDM28275.1 aspartyl/glutamyl-tRNA(Asn/Gln) amidotransferase subunit C [Aerococcus urinaehominis]
MEFTNEEIQHIANLSKLAFNDEEVAMIRDQFANIVNMVQELDQVDTEGVEAMAYATDVHNIMREDQAQAGTDRDLLMKNVPAQKDGMIEVPAIMNDEGGKA